MFLPTVQSTKRILVPGVLDRHMEDRLVVDSSWWFKKNIALLTSCTIIKITFKQHCDTSVLLYTFFEHEQKTFKDNKEDRPGG